MNAKALNLLADGLAEIIKARLAPLNTRLSAVETRAGALATLAGGRGQVDKLSELEILLQRVQALEARLESMETK